MPHLAISLLGTLEVTLDGQPATGFESAKVRALFAYLALEAAQPHRREVLATLFWPDVPDEVARSNLRQALANLRRVIGDQTADPPFLAITRDQVQFNRQSDHWLDVAAFTELLAACSSHLHRSAPRCSTCQQRLREATALYRGPLLAQFYLADSAVFEEWIANKRERLQQQALAALERVATHCEASGQYDDAQLYARRLLELDPWHEGAHRQLMRVLWLGGQRSAALAQYRRLQLLLQAELGVEPETETAALNTRIQAGEPHENERFRPIVARLPRSLSPLIGRETELAELARLLEQPDCGLITLVGLGGVGKTRLAVQAASDQRAMFPDGVYFVPLAPVASAEFLVPAIATSLAFTFDGPTDLDAQLVEHLRNKELLLVLDNIEHLLGGTSLSANAELAEVPATWVNLLVQIREQAPGVTLLVTSRERLQLQTEWVMPLEGLSYPANGELEQLATYSAVQLFVQRTQHANVGFTLSPVDRPHVGRICRLVDGLPLGIELAAAWVGERECGQIADRIEANVLALASSYRDVVARHRSLRAVLDYSWHLLAAEDQRALRQMAVFRGGFWPAAAQAVAGASEPILTSLCARSLLRQETGPEEAQRYGLHELVRQYAFEQLQAAGETDQARDRHLDVCLALAEEAEPQLTGTEQAAWLERLEREHDNFRAALAWALDRQKDELAARLGVALWRFWWVRSYLAEGRRWLEQILKSRPNIPPEVRAKALKAGGTFAWGQGDYEAARVFLTDGIALWRELGDSKGIALALNDLGNIAYYQGDHATARTRYEESLHLQRERHDPHGMAIALGGRGNLAALEGDYPAARTDLEESLALFREVEDEHGVATSHLNLGVIAYFEGEMAVARAYYEESLALCSKLGDRQGMSVAISDLGDVAIEEREFAAARAHYEESLAMQRELGDKWGIANSLFGLGLVAYGEEDYSEAWAFHEECLRMRHVLGDQRGVAEALEAFAALAFCHGDPQRALQLAGAAAGLREVHRMPQTPPSQARLDRWVESAREVLGATASSAAWAAGQAMTMEQAFAHALRDAW